MPTRLTTGSTYRQYLHWKMDVELDLTMNHYGKYIKSDVSEDEKKTDEWKRNDEIARAFILLPMSVSLFDEVDEHESARGVWEALEKRFEPYKSHLAIQSANKLWFMGKKRFNHPTDREVYLAAQIECLKEAGVSTPDFWKEFFLSKSLPPEQRAPIDVSKLQANQQ